MHSIEKPSSRALSTGRNRGHQLTNTFLPLHCTSLLRDRLIHHLYGTRCNCVGNCSALAEANVTDFKALPPSTEDISRRSSRNGSFAFIYVPSATMGGRGINKLRESLGWTAILQHQSSTNLAIFSFASSFLPPSLFRFRHDEDHNLRSAVFRIDFPNNIRAM